MQIVTLSLFNFAHLRGKLWAFSQMGLMRPAVLRMEGLTFAKMLGSGDGAGFSLKPDFSTYGLLCAWDGIDSARAAQESAAPFARYRGHATRWATLYLAATRTRGQWSGCEPFEVAPATSPQGAIVAITRARLKWSKLIPFWSMAPGVSERVEAEPHQRFMKGLGEVPYKQMMTFSIWDDEQAMRDFSLNSPSHGTAVRRAWQEGWFAEYLFARFNLLAVEGEWPGLEHFEQDTAEPQSMRAA